MPENFAGLIARSGPELVFGLVGAVGTDLAQVSHALREQLIRVGYSAYEIRVSALMHSLDRFRHLSAMSGSEYERIKAHMKAGSELRSLAQKGDILALMAVAQIRQLRLEHGDVVEVERPRTPLRRTAYIIRSIKHPSEIDTLRDIYGRAFFVVSAYSPRSKRVATLAGVIADSEGNPDHGSFRGKAEELIRIDEEEEDAPLGQDVRDSFPQGDVFVDARSRDRLNESLERFVDAVFGNPFVTPMRDEFGMFHAYSTALRSADLGRQVGAAIATNTGEVAAVGCNDVPHAGGGQYWPDNEPDARDFQLGYDSSARFRQKITTELAAKLTEAGWIPPHGWDREPQKLAGQIADKGLFKGTRLQNLLEYGRAVHAEMAAITDAARRGVSIKDSTLYSTTFPCHLCARHIIAAGVRRVVYIEPYPKSVAEELYGDSLTVDAEEHSGTKVAFEPFVGISPSLYTLAFGLVPGSRKDSKGEAKSWQPSKAEPRFKQFVASYLLIENTVLDTVLPSYFERMSIHPINPTPTQGSLEK